MKLGADNPIKTGVAIAMMALSALWFVYTMSGFLSTPAQDAASVGTTTTATKAATPARSRVARKRQPVTAAVLTPTLDPRLRLDLLKTSEQTSYAGSGRNIFRAEAEVVEIPKPVVTPVLKQEAPRPPPPPPINLRFFGFASRQGEAKRIFLSEGDDVFIAREGDIVNRRYKVLRIGNTSVEIQDVLNNNVQTIPLSQG